VRFRVALWIAPPVGCKARSASPAELSQNCGKKETRRHRRGCPFSVTLPPRLGSGLPRDFSPGQLTTGFLRENPVSSRTAARVPVEPEVGRRELSVRPPGGAHSWNYPLGVVAFGRWLNLPNLRPRPHRAFSPVMVQPALWLLFLILGQNVFFLPAWRHDTCPRGHISGFPWPPGIIAQSALFISILLMASIIWEPRRRASLRQALMVDACRRPAARYHGEARSRPGPCARWCRVISVWGTGLP